MWTIEPGRDHLIEIVWIIELDTFHLTGIRDHNRQSIRNRKLLIDY